MMLNIFPYAYFPPVCLLWWGVCADLLLILKIGLFVFLFKNHFWSQSALVCDGQQVPMLPSSSDLKMTLPITVLGKGDAVHHQFAENNNFLPSRVFKKNLMLIFGFPLQPDFLFPACPLCDLVSGNPKANYNPKMSVLSYLKLETTWTLLCPSFCTCRPLAWTFSFLLSTPGAFLSYALLAKSGSSSRVSFQILSFQNQSKDFF